MEIVNLNGHKKWIRSGKTRKNGSWFPSSCFPRTVKNVIVGTICYKKSKILSRTYQDANIPIRTINDHSDIFESEKQVLFNNKETKYNNNF